MVTGIHVAGSPIIVAVPPYTRSNVDWSVTDGVSSDVDNNESMVLFSHRPADVRANTSFVVADAICTSWDSDKYEPAVWRTEIVPFDAALTTIAIGSFKFGAVGSVAVNAPAVVGETYNTSPAENADVLTWRILPIETT